MVSIEIGFEVRPTHEMRRWRRLGTQWASERGRSVKFSNDRTIAQYAVEIRQARPCPVP